MFALSLPSPYRIHQRKGRWCGFRPTPGQGYTHTRALRCTSALMCVRGPPGGVGVSALWVTLSLLPPVARFTRPPTRRSFNFVAVYIAEAHASDVWPISSARYNAARGPVSIPTPTDDQRRCQLAAAYAANFEFPVPFLVDPVCDTFEREYAPWPFRCPLLGGCATQCSRVVVPTGARSGT